MQKPRFGIAALAFVALACCLARPHSAVAQEHAPDANVTTDHVQSISILPTPNAPFTATVVTETIDIGPSGTTRTLYNRRTVARDSAGRVFQERRWLMPKGNVELTPLSNLQYQDPNRHRVVLCDALQHVCNAYPFNLQKPDAVTVATRNRTVTTAVLSEDLGGKRYGTLELVGSRETTPIAEAIPGTDKPQPMVKEFWYSPYLGINVVTKRTDPRISAVQNFSVEDIDLKEPDPKLFDPPADYRMVDTSQANGPTMIVYNQYVSCPVFGGCTSVLRPIVVRRRR